MPHLETIAIRGLHLVLNRTKNEGMTSALDKAVAAEIRAEMARGGTRVADVAATLSISASTASKLVKGERSIDLTELEMISDLLGVDPLALMARTQRDAA